MSVTIHQGDCLDVLRTLPADSVDAVMIEEPITTYQDWCKAHDCSHGHCPEECEHPQPFVEEGEAYCARCAVMGGVASKMVPCSPETCLDG